MVSIESTTFLLSQLDQDHWGLKQIWPPPDSQIITKYDLVLVHGLSGGSMSTWFEAAQPPWLSWLIEAIPGIRIHTFGYNIRNVYLYTSDTTQLLHGRTFTDAETLCAEILNIVLQDEKPIPITFLAHGVGGIIVKSALSYCGARPEAFGQILQQTNQVIFLDTPHRGLDESKWVTLYGSTATGTGSEQYGLWTTTLADLAKYFAGISDQFAITSVFATLPTAIEGASEMLYLPNEICLHFSDVSHKSMCKFKSSNDQNFRKLRDRIVAEFRRTEINHAQMAMKNKIVHQMDQTVREMQKDNKIAFEAAMKSQKEQHKSEATKLRAELRKWLVSSDSSIDYNRVIDDPTRRMTMSTCTWIDGTQEFRSWDGSALSRIAWLHGIQGCGKSTLVSRLVELKKGAGHKVLHFFFEPEVVVSTIQALSCLAHQMLLDEEAVTQALQPLYERTASTRMASLPTAKSVFMSSLKAYGPCYVFVDALDNCPDHTSMIRVLFEALKTFSMGVKVFCSSRDIHEISKLFDNETLVDEIAVTPAKIQDDVKRFVVDEMSRNEELRDKLEAFPETISFIEERLTSKANGMFLLPKLFIQELADKTELSEMYTFLDVLPSSLHDYYLRIVSTMPAQYHSLAKKVLTWLVFGRRPLRLAEIQEALSLEGAVYLNLKLDIKKALGCLVSIDENVLRLSHDSARRFLANSSLFRQHQTYSLVMSAEPNNDIMEVCIRYLLKISPPQSFDPTQRFAGQRAEVVREATPFIEYAAREWPWHWKAAEEASRHLPLVEELLNSESCLIWIEKLGHFLNTEAYRRTIDTLRDVVLKLQVNVRVMERPENPRAQGLAFIRYASHAARVAKIADLAAKLSAFLASWGSAIQFFPDEVYTLGPLIHCPDFCDGPQRYALTSHPDKAESASLYNLLDNFPAPAGFDRFCLSDKHVFMWSSLMPSSPWNLAYEERDPERSAIIELLTVSIESNIPCRRYGIDPAAIGLLTVNLALTKDHTAAAITWIRFEQNGAGPCTFKTYAWGVTEDYRLADLKELEWSYLGEDDPCRVDLTSSLTFRGSRRASAFTANNESLWTPGGTYRLIDGERRPAPSLFLDTEMSCLTFSENASLLVGIRSREAIEIYETKTGTHNTVQLCSRVLGDFIILDVSPTGRFTMCLRKKKSVSRSEDLELSGPRVDKYQVCIVSREGAVTVLWDEECDRKTRRSSETPSEPSDEIHADKNPIPHFYNNGGLHGFSVNESTLVICVPDSRDWLLLAFDLECSNIAESVWPIDYAAKLSGAGIMSISFCPVHERRLYLLDSYSVIQSFEISRAGLRIGSELSTLDVEDVPPVWTTIPRDTDGLISAVSLKTGQGDNPDILIRQWSPAEHGPRIVSSANATFARIFRDMKSTTLIIDPSPLFESFSLADLCALDRWSRLTSHVQSSIDDTISGTVESIETIPDYGKLKPSALPKTTTKVVFDASATLGFFLTVCYVPLIPNAIGHECWLVTVIVDIVWLETLRSRKTGIWNFTLVSGVEKEYIDLAYHSGSKTLVYSVGLKCFDITSGQHSNESILGLCHLSSIQDGEVELDSRPNYLRTRKLVVGEWSRPFPDVDLWNYPNWIAND